MAAFAPRERDDEVLVVLVRGDEVEIEDAAVDVEDAMLLVVADKRIVSDAVTDAMVDESRVVRGVELLAGAVEGDKIAVEDFVEDSYVDVGVE